MATIPLDPDFQELPYTQDPKFRKTLSELNDFMVSVYSNVTSFNEFVILQMDAILRIGDSSSYVMKIHSKDIRKNDYEEVQHLLERSLMTYSIKRVQRHGTHWKMESSFLTTKGGLGTDCQTLVHYKEEGDKRQTGTRHINGRKLHPTA